MKAHLNQLSKWTKRCIAFVFDTSATFIAWIGAIWLSSNAILNTVNLIAIKIAILIQCVCYILYGLYRGVWRFASIPDLVRILRAVLVATAITLVFLKLNNLYIPFKTYIIDVVLLVAILSGSRLLFRWSRDYPKFFPHSKRVLVVGAGSAGEALIRDLYRSSFMQHYLPVAFVDDDTMRHGSEVRGVRVVGACKDIAQIVREHTIELILIAIPSATSKRMREIVSYCEESNVPFRTLPGLKNIADGVVKINSLREIVLEDLLGREQVYHDSELIKSAIKNKTILVTGGGGSIGSELCRQICSHSPANLIIVDNSEFNLYCIDLEIQKKAHHTHLFSHLCSVTDKLGMQKIFNLYKPDLVFHVAAYKHVPLLESHIRAAMYNNIIGTKIVADLAEQTQVETFVLISTDKAVNPTSIMGATKRASEVYCQTFNLHSSTRFITVRFGNVLDSAGSVIPLFRQQLLNGGPITVTHPSISRYFMTIPEASQLILQATSMKHLGEIFVLDMGEPVNIRYLAEQMIKLSGKIVGQDIEIKYTGLRPGEKLYEELFHESENTYETTHPKIKQAKVRHYDWTKLTINLAAIQQAYEMQDENALLNLLRELVPEYKNNQHSETSTQENSFKTESSPLVHML